MSEAESADRSDQRSFVVVGGGLAGAKAVEGLRERGFGGRVVLLGAEPHLPYERPPLSKAYLKTGEKLDEAFVHDQEWYDAHNIEVRTSTRVVAVDRDAKTVRTQDGQQVRYDRLLLTTGASPRTLSIPGADLPGVLTLRTIEDSDRIRQVLREGNRVVFVGGGWIGLEVASAAAEAGARVTVLEALELPLVRVLGPRIAQVFVDLHREHGVDLRTGVTVQALEPQEGRPDAVGAVLLGDGTRIPADAVVVGVGAAPNVQLAEAAGLEVDNGVVADAVGRTSDPDIFVAGDLANAEHPFLGRRVRVEHWANALNQPAVVVAGMLDEAGPQPELPYFFTDQYDLGMEYTGLASAEDDVVVRGDLATREFIAFWLRDGRVTAGMNVNVWDVTEPINALVTSRAVVDPQRLADQAVPLEELT
ncbi:NAD(P)/FAD-dependent oxidoreductase [Pedococcus sp. 5OH_020]|uniref:NAD(P)/FAD-dependent oxidoreductase n=1 Tax=Pedococcus sp. 5OH_020 TaxID=2989814 RepID=UPI0022E9A20E|nr:FAD-dependent oxidoreductase [Pedococcus sp. 5OH_020]